MHFVIYDGSFEGLITCVFEVYDRRIQQARIVKEAVETESLFAMKTIVHTDQAKADRVLKRVEELCGKDGVSLLFKCYLSEKKGIEDHVLKTLQYLFKEGKNVFKDYGDPHVLELKQTEKMMRRERHRMTAFVRFELGSDGLYYSIIEPDFDVLPLIIKHFQGRYADQRWLIFDKKRGYGIYYDLHSTSYVKPEAHDKITVDSSTIEFDQKEELYQQLWAGYFKSTNIKERKNMKLHLQHVPKRYWKYLTEKTALI